MKGLIYKCCLILMILIVSKISVLGQTNQKKIDSLLIQLQSTEDTVKLDALKKLTWELRFSDPIKGFEYAFEGLNLAESLYSKKDIATLHNYISVLAIKILSYDKAKTHVLKAYQIADTLNLFNEKAYALNNLGEIYYLMGQFDSSIICLKEAMGMFKSINNLTGLAYAYNQMGMALRNQKNYDEAFRYHSLSLEIRKQLKDNFFAAKAYLNMGIDLLEKKDFEEARKYFEMVDTKQLQNQKYFSIPYLEILIGNTYQGEKDDNKAIRYFKDAYKHAQVQTLYFEMRDAAKLLSDVFGQQKNHQTALFYFNSYKIWDDSIKNLNVVEKFKQLEMKRAFDQQYKFLEYKMKQDLDSERLKSYWNRVLLYVFIAFMILLLVFIVIQIRNYKIISKQNKQLVLQKTDIETKNEELFTQNQQISEQNEAIVLQRDALAIANATKDKFFSIIAHDLRGPVGNLTAFFDTIVDSYQHQIDPKLMEFFNVVNTSVQQTYILLENLLTWAQLQNGTIPFNPGLNSISTIIDNNINLIKSRAEEKSISIINKLPKELATKFDSYMIDSIVRNLLSNAIKFTHKNGTIKISSETIGNTIKISIVDTGIGLSNGDIEKLFRIDVKHKSKDGTDGERGSGLGLILCKEFIEKHKGKIFIESVLGKGSAFAFTLPLINS